MEQEMTKEQLIIYGARLRLAWFRKAFELRNVKEACEYYGIERSVYYYWYKRWIESGKDVKSLYDKPKSRKIFPRILNDFQIDLILNLRKESRGGKHTIHFLLKRDYGIENISEWIINETLRDSDLLKKVCKKKPRIKEYDNYPYYPGEEGQLDVKYYKRLTYQYSLLDMATRIKFKMVFDGAYPENSVIFIKQAKKFFEPVFFFKKIRTDQGTEFTYSMFAHVRKAHPFEEWLKEEGIIHKIFRAQPQKNGRVEKSHRTDKYMLSDVDWSNLNLMIKETKRDCLYYNTKRPHYALNMKTPIEYLQGIKGYEDKKPDLSLLV